MTTSRARFLETQSDVLSVVEVNVPLGARGIDFPWRTLFGPRAQVAAAEFRVEGDRLVQRLHVCEFVGAPIGDPQARDVGRRLVSPLTE